jgi:hypothetical protein
MCNLPTGRVLFTTSRQSWLVAEAQFTPDGSRLVTASDDGRVRSWDAATGLLLSESTRNGSDFQRLQIAPDGHRLLTVSPDAARLWEAPFYPAPTPPWLPILAEAVAGRRLNSQRQFEPAPVRDLIELRHQIANSTSTDPYTRWARWFFADRATRPQSPEAICTVAEHVQRLIDANQPDGLREAIYYSPTNREAFARLAKVLRAINTKSNAAIAAQADWCEHKANEPAPR